MTEINNVKPRTLRHTTRPELTDPAQSRAAEPEEIVEKTPKRGRRPSAKKKGSILAGHLQKILAAAIILCLGLVVFIIFIITRDTTPPVIQQVSLSDPAESSAIITWQTDEPATSQVTIWDSEVYTSTEPEETLVTNHSATLSALKFDTRYKLILISRDKGGNEARLEIELTIPAQPYSTPPVISVGPEVDNLAPDFTLTTLDDKEVSLSQLRGKLVMVNFWQSSCSACKDEMPHLQATYEKWPRDKLEILAISVGERTAFVQSFVDRQEVTFPALLDPDEAVSEIYQISRFPTTFFINADGIIKGIKEGRFKSQFEIEDMLDSL
jgi:peroxiredoxin